jgi:hypothetical protein
MNMILKAKFLFLITIFTNGFFSIAYSDELKLYVVKPFYDLDWSSPSALVLSFQENQKTSSGVPIGHLAIELNCESSSESNSIHILDGMNMKDDGEAYKALDEGRGMGVLIDNYSGQLHGDQYLTELNKFSCDKNLLLPNGDSRLSYIKFKINPKTCLRIANYYSQYISRGIDRVYGGLNTRPLKGEPRGASCSAFAMSVLEISGLYKSEFDNLWSRDFRIPENQMGTKISPVSLVDIVLKGNSWASPIEVGTDVRFQDPALIYKWISEQLKMAATSNENTSDCYSKGIVLDYQNEKTPEDDIWKTF